MNPRALSVLLAASFAGLPVAKAETNGVLARVAPPDSRIEPAPEPVSRPMAPSGPEHAEDTKARWRDRWLLSIEGAVHVPSDAGVQLGVETPFRLRGFVGFGIVPVEWLTGIAAGATEDAEARLALRAPRYTGTLFRAELGYRLFPALGFYVDAGYARATLRGSFDAADNPFADAADIEGSYRSHSTLDLASIELGHQWRIGGRGVLALGIGVIRTFNADTRVSVDGNSDEVSRLVEGAERADGALESYGTLPFLALRAGVDVL